MKRYSLGLALAVTALLPLAGAYAQTTYTDNAAAYSSSYDGVNHGTGFGAFSVSAVNPSPPYAGTFIGDASTSEQGGGTPAPSTINTSSQAFGFYANQGAAASVTILRNFTNNLTKTNDSFSLDFLTGYNDTGTAGVALRNAGGNVATLNYSGPSGFFTFNGGASSISTYNSGVLHLTYTLLSSSSVRLDVTGAITASQTASFTGPITGFEVYQTNTTNSGTNTQYYNGYFNNLSETISAASAPEPGDLALLAFGLGMLGLVRRRLSAR